MSSATRAPSSSTLPIFGTNGRPIPEGADLEVRTQFSIRLIIRKKRMQHAETPAARDAVTGRTVPFPPFKCKSLDGIVR